MVVGESAYGESQIQALSEEIKNGQKQRKKFVSVTKDDLLKIVSEKNYELQQWKRNATISYVAVTVYPTSFAGKLCLPWSTLTC